MEVVMSIFLILWILIGFTVLLGSLISGERPPLPVDILVWICGAVFIVLAGG